MTVRLPVSSVGFAFVVSARLDKDNYRRILSALRAGVGVDVEELIEQ